MPEYVGALLCLAVIPASIAMVELPQYMCYGRPRLDTFPGKRWMVLAFTIFFLTIQNATLLLMIEWRFIAYRFTSMLQVAVFVGLAYLRQRRLFPLRMMHFLKGLNVGLTVLAFSLT